MLWNHALNSHLEGTSLLWLWKVTHFVGIFMLSGILIRIFLDKKHKFYWKKLELYMSGGQVYVNYKSE